MAQGCSDLTSQLNAARAGDRDAAERALGQVYAELKRMAGGLLRGNPLTVDATSLVHDAFLRLIPESERQFADRRHFFRLAARAMRQILVDHVRARSADKRGGAWVRTQLTDRLAATGGVQNAEDALKMLMVGADAVIATLRAGAKLPASALYARDHVLTTAAYTWVRYRECDESLRMRNWSAMPSATRI